MLDFLLPGKLKLIDLRSAKEIWEAIYLLKVRGAPAIGVCAGMGIYLLAKEIYDNDPHVEYEQFYQEFIKQKDYLKRSNSRSVLSACVMIIIMRVIPGRLNISSGFLLSWDGSTTFSSSSTGGQ